MYAGRRSLRCRPLADFRERDLRPPGSLAVDGPKRPFQEAPIGPLRELHQRVLHIDDLIKPRAKQILLTALVVASKSFARAQQRQRITACDSREILNPNLQENRPPKSDFRQNQSTTIFTSHPSILPFPNFSRRTILCHSAATSAAASATKAGGGDLRNICRSSRRGSLPIPASPIPPSSVDRAGSLVTVSGRRRA